jgi:two-component system invasion response regulator UvrY
MRFLIADDHTIVREGIKHLLTDNFPLALIVDVADTVELLKHARKEKWDVVISDISMPPGDSGLEAIKSIREHDRKLPVLVLSMHNADQYAIRAIRAGALGYLTKETAATELVKAVTTLLSGRKYLSPDVAAALADALQDNTAHSVDQLTNRELEVFKMLASGTPVSGIAKHLILSANTISSFRARIFGKMGFHNNLELVRYAVDHKLV